MLASSLDSTCDFMIPPKVELKEFPAVFSQNYMVYQMIHCSTRVYGRET